MSMYNIYPEGLMIDHEQGLHVIMTPCERGSIITQSVIYASTMNVGYLLALRRVLSMHGMLLSDSEDDRKLVEQVYIALGHYGV